jgi:hypothetical protein
MSVSTKKLIGTIVLLVGLSIYLLFTLSLGQLVVPRVWYWELPYYGVMGIIWVFPTRQLLYWMHREN